MKGNEFLDKMALVDPAYVEAADRKPAARKPDGWRRPFRMWAAATCLCLLCGGALFALSRFSHTLPPGDTPPAAGPGGMDIPALEENSSRENPSQEDGSSRGDGSSQEGGSSRGENLPASAPTSDTYSDLEQLLSHLSASDYHGEGDSRSNGSGVSSGLQTEGRDTVSFGEYTYQLSPEKEILIYKSGMQIGSLPSPANFLFLTGNRLAAVRTMREGMEPDSQDSAYVDIYDLTSPDAPEFLECFVQQGSITACFLADNTLCLMTSDGVCACGWSRLKNTADYIPGLLRGNGRTLTGIEWTREEIRILGEPSRIKYVAVTKIDITRSEITGKCAYYGDIEDVFYGPGWYAFCTESVTEKILSLPELYTFDFSMEYSGKVDTSRLFGLEKTVSLQNGGRPAGEYPDIVSVSRCGEIWSILGLYRTLSDTGAFHEELFAAAYDPAAGGIRHALASAPESSFSIDDVLWEENRAIVSAGFSSAGSDGLEEKARIIFAEFHGMEIDLQVSSLLCDRVRGVDMVYWMGNPFGAIRPFISLGNGIYLRYNSVPDGFDLYDFRDSSRPECLYRSEGDIPRGYRLDFVNHVYDEHTVGVKMLVPEKGEYRNMTEAWCIFSIDPHAEEPVKKLKEYKDAGVDYTAIVP